MARKIPKIVLFAILFSAVFNLDFQKIGANPFSPKKYLEQKTLFFSGVQAKKKPEKKRKARAKKLFKENNASGFQNPIAISGDEICQKNSREALRILFSKDRENFDFVASRLGKIECAVFGSGVYPWETPTRFKVGVATSNAEPVWFASVLVHESCHIEQFKKGAGSEYSGEKAEKECLGAQINSLEKLGASRPKIDYVANVAQSQYWLVDISHRWW